VQTAQSACERRTEHSLIPDAQSLMLSTMLSTTKATAITAAGERGYRCDICPGVRAGRCHYPSKSGRTYKQCDEAHRRTTLRTVSRTHHLGQRPFCVLLARARGTPQKTTRKKDSLNRAMWLTQLKVHVSEPCQCDGKAQNQHVEW
jgi:hypothetical protein